MIECPNLGWRDADDFLLQLTSGFGEPAYTEDRVNRPAVSQMGMVYRANREPRRERLIQI